MTCIAGICVDGRAWLGADSCASDFWTYDVARHEKVFAVGGLVFGVCGSFRTRDLLRYGFRPPSRGRSDPDRFVRVELVNALRRRLTKMEALQKKDGVAALVDSEFIVGFAGRLWRVQEDLAVLDVPPWGCSIGSGEEVALGALYALRESKLSPERRLRAALEAAAAVVPSVRGPFVVLEAPAAGKG